MAEKLRPLVPSESVTVVSSVVVRWGFGRNEPVIGPFVQLLPLSWQVEIVAVTTPAVPLLRVIGPNSVTLRPRNSRPTTLPVPLKCPFVVSVSWRTIDADAVRDVGMAPVIISKSAVLA